jgi:hypothetical protein
VFGSMAVQSYNTVSYKKQWIDDALISVIKYWEFEICKLPILPIALIGLLCFWEKSALSVKGKGCFVVMTEKNI